MTTDTINTPPLSAEFFESYGTAFRQTYETAHQEVREQEARKKQDHQQKDWHFLRANLGHFCPEVSPDRYEAIYLRLLTNHRLSAQSFRYVDFGSLDHLSVKGDTTFMQPTEAARPARIFCTYHLGGYRGIMAMLLNAGYPLTLVIDRRTLTQQQSYIESVSENLRAHNPAAGTVEVIEAENPAIGRNMAGALHRGRSILIFLDGNTGVGGLYDRNKRQLSIPFLNGTIVSRTGIAVLAHATRTPIVPLISYYKTVEGCALPYYEALPTLMPQSGVAAATFVRETTQQLYDYLAHYLRQYVDQWESWFYWHKFLDHDALAAQSVAEPGPGLPPTEGPLRFNEQRFGLFKIDRDTYALDRQTYKAYQLPAQDYDWLHELRLTADVATPPLIPAPDEATRHRCWQLGLVQI